MNKFKFLLPIMLMVMAGLFVSCSDKDDTEPESQQSEAPVFQTKTIETPQGLDQSSNPGAQETKSFINMANGLSGFAGMFTPPQKSGIYKSTNEGSPWVYSWEVNDETGSYTVTLTVTETLTKNTWNIVLNGEMDGLILIDFNYLYGEEAKDGKSGLFQLNDPETQNLGFELSWETDSNDVDTFRFFVPEDIKITITHNPDDSGALEVEEWINGQFYMTFAAIWTASGSGESWEYDMGTIINHEIW